MTKFNKSGKKEKRYQEIESSTPEGVPTDVAPVEATAPVENQESVSEPKNTARFGMTQREGVYQEVMRELSAQGVTHDGTQAVKPLLNEANLKAIYAALIAGFQTKQIFIKDTESNQKKLADPKLLELYVVGLVNNWLKRDPRLNGKGPKKS